MKRNRSHRNHQRYSIQQYQKQIWIPIPSPSKSVNCIQCGERHTRCPEPLSRLSKEFLTYPSDTAWCVVSIDVANQTMFFLFFFSSLCQLRPIETQQLRMF